MGTVSVSDAVSYINPYNHWKGSGDSDESEDAYDLYRDRENFKIIPLIEIIPQLLHEIDSGLQKDIANIIISFMVTIDLTAYLSKQLTVDYIVEDLNIYDFQPKECRKKHRKTRAFIVECLSFSGAEIIVESPLKDMAMQDMADLDGFEVHKHKLPEVYKKIISQNQHSKYIKFGKKFKKIPPHIFWWKAIEDSFKEYFTKKFDFNKDIAHFIECNGISELRKHGFLHSCVEGPPLYDTKHFDIYQKWYIEFFAVCTNVEPKQNRNSFPYFVIEDKDELIFEMKVVTYSNQKELGLHIPRYD